jgi:hypothetical protein
MFVILYAQKLSILPTIDLIVIALARASPTPTCNVLLQQFSGFEAIETRRELFISRGEVVNQSPKI